MAGMNDLMKKYGLADPSKPEMPEVPKPPLPPEEAPTETSGGEMKRLETPEVPKPPLPPEEARTETPGGEMQRLETPEVPEPPLPPEEARTETPGGEMQRLKTPEVPKPPLPPEEAQTETPGGMQPPEILGGQQLPPEPPGGQQNGFTPGAFEGEKNAGDVPVPGEKRTVSPRRPQWLDRLPPLWGIDAGLIALSAAGLLYIALHWSLVLLVVAQAIYAAANVALGLLLFLGLGAAAYALWGRR